MLWNQDVQKNAWVAWFSFSFGPLQILAPSPDIVKYKIWEGRWSAKVAGDKRTNIMGQLLQNVLKGITRFNFQRICLTYHGGLKSVYVAMNNSASCSGLHPYETHIVNLKLHGLSFSLPHPQKSGNITQFLQTMVFSCFMSGFGANFPEVPIKFCRSW